MQMNIAEAKAKLAELLDTRTWEWSLFRVSGLSAAARYVIEQARTFYIPPRFISRPVRSTK